MQDAFQTNYYWKWLTYPDKLISVKKNFTCNYSNYTNLILKKLDRYVRNLTNRQRESIDLNLVSIDL